MSFVSTHGLAVVQRLLHTVLFGVSVSCVPLRKPVTQQTTKRHDTSELLAQVDFAHTFPSDGQPDENFTAGARALLQALTAVLSMDAHDCLI